jgi:hypothetical protein
MGYTVGLRMKTKHSEKKNAVPGNSPMGEGIPAFPGGKRLQISIEGSRSPTDVKLAQTAAIQSAPRTTSKGKTGDAMNNIDDWNQPEGVGTMTGPWVLYSPTLWRITTERGMLWKALNKPLTTLVTVMIGTTSH